MLHECRATHILLVIWDAEIDGGIHFQVWPEERSMSGQNRSNKVKFLKFKISIQKHTYVVQFCLRIPEMLFFYVRQLEKPKIAFEKVTSSPLLGFLTIA